jgi:hypothetical protein
MTVGGFRRMQKSCFEPSLYGSSRPKKLADPNPRPQTITRATAGRTPSREAQCDPFSSSSILFQELSSGTSLSWNHEIDGHPLSPTIAVKLEVNGSIVRLFNAITTFRTAQDVGLQELRIEMSYPPDAERAAQPRILQNFAQLKGSAPSNENIAF